MDGLRGEVAEEVDYEGGFELCEVGGAGLHGGVGAEGDFDGVDPGGVGVSEGFSLGGILRATRGLAATGGGLVARGGVAGGFMAFENVSLDVLLEATDGGASSEEGECHLFGKRNGMGSSKVKGCYCMLC